MAMARRSVVLLSTLPLPSRTCGTSQWGLCSARSYVAARPLAVRRGGGGGGGGGGGRERNGVLLVANLLDSVLAGGGDFF